MVSYTLTALGPAIFAFIILAAFIPIGGGPFAIIGPIANLVVGLLLLIGVGCWGCSTVTCRLVFYGFTAPAWAFLLWAAPHFISELR